ncbi:MAG: energy-coupled thiamine transporter ThiT [Helcococcus sp.]|nr:energy-coupled thiamine transporter ThiT [Helcococcus sp.]
MDNNKSNKTLFSTQMIVEAGIMIALSLILGEFKLFEMPQGGSVSFGMLPLIIFAIRWGVLSGMIVGALYSILSVIIFSGIILGPIQYLLDYPLAYAFMGLSGISTLKNKSDIKGYIPFIIVAYLLKFVCHFLSGMIFFAIDPKNIFTLENARNSFLYNITYIGPEILIFVVILVVLNQSFKRFLVKQY